MGFSSDTLRPTVIRLLCGIQVVAWPDWRASAVAKFLAEARTKLTELLETLPVDGSSFRKLEEQMHRVISGCLDAVTAAALGAAHFADEVLAHVELLRELTPHLRLQNSKEMVAVRFFGGSVHLVPSPYLLQRPPRGPGRPRGKGRRGPAGNGLYPFLAVLGVQGRITPALASEVALQVACAPQEQARSNLARRGIELKKKVLQRIVKGLGSTALAYREKRIKTGLAYELGDVSGARIVIETDGGRIRTRAPRLRGRKRASGRRGFDVPWREPKVITIYEIDAEGRKQKKGGFRYHDATMGDAEEAFKLLTGILRSVKANHAKQWVVIGDGARWIWTRIDELVAALGYEKSKVTEVVDLYHAREKLHEFAMEIRSFSKRQRTRWENRMRGHLDRGELELMEEEFSRFFKGCNSKVRRSLAAYFKKNAERMRYAAFYAANIPVGSGAVESCVRRLVNLRMKGNGIFWRLENAEHLLFLRSQMLSGHWDAFIDNILRPLALWTNSARREPSSYASGACM